MRRGENRKVGRGVLRQPRIHKEKLVISHDYNDLIEYSMWSVFKYSPRDRMTDRTSTLEEVRQLFEHHASDVKVRGIYRVSGLRADADWFVWWHSPSITALQDIYENMRRTELGRSSEPVWSGAGLHRPAEFNRDHIPAYMKGIDPASYLTVYPFVRSYDWYLLPESERRDLLVEHGAAARSFSDVISNTVSSFALGDYEWILALEAEELHRLVDLMRAFRNTRARLHVREETPFFTGQRVSLETLCRGLL